MNVKNIVICSIIYFCLVFLAGFLLGIFRVLVMVPAIGARYAELIEMPVMLVIIYYSARYLLNRWFDMQSTANHGSALAIGILALFFLLTLEFSLVLSIQGISITEYMSYRDPVSGSAYVFGLMVYMLMPYMLIRKQT